jgi:(1->4)-alpha-D-glucan 1-alpha-D-glucosylmutase
VPTPAASMPPTATYRVQLTADFTFDDAAAVVPYLADLGVSHLYCSPYLRAAPRSTHGYDVVDHAALNPELGGAAAYDRLVAACRAAGLGLVLDVVPNHMAVSEPQSQNAAWWAMLRDGPDSPAARWFDVDWHSRDNPGKVLVPVLGAPVGDCLDRGEITVEADRIRYHDHELPLRPGTEKLPLPELLDAQHWRLCHWRVAGEELNYRRFFDITTLAGLRVEDPAVFEATHALVLAQVRDGVLAGLRIDHPDGLADPAGYLRRLAEATGGVWTVVEKILEPGEALPADWPCAGTTGYDALNLVTGLFVDPAGAEPLTRLYGELTREPTDWPAVVTAAKAHVIREVLSAEVGRLTDLLVTAAWGQRRTRDHTRRALREALVGVLTAFEVYRAYVEPGAPPSAEARATVARACGRARAALPHRAAEVDLVGELVLTGPAELVTRFQQACGPVMAKGVEDTAFYRYHRLVALNEVGGDPGRFGIPVADFHTACVAAQRDWPATMTTLSTHDTKRSEDVRARLVTLSEDPRGWAETAARLLALGERHTDPATGWPDRNAAYLLLQTLFGAWPLSTGRAVDYLTKATREAKQHTSWTDPDPAYDAARDGYVRGVLGDDEFVAVLTASVARLRPAARVTSLAQKLVQLTMPGVPDVYQGSELETLALVDPDNRRPVDYAQRRRLLASPGSDEKLAVVAAALRLRRDRPEWFGREGGYAPLVAEGSAAAYVVGFVRGGAVATVVPRLVLGLTRRGGFGDTAVRLPAGSWRHALTGADIDGVEVRVADLLAPFPVALLVRTG